MNALRALFPPFVGGRIGIGLLLLRVVLGIGMMSHGWSKIQNATGWMNRPGHAGPPGVLQALGAAGEFFGGLGLVLGVLTPIAALGVVCTMLGALILVHFPKGTPWLSTKMGVDTWEDVGFYLFGGLALLLAGPGLFSIDAQLFGRRDAAVGEERLRSVRGRS